jgi:hydrophobe/amphiphile efflux-3 (HAE3) family protein
LEAESIIRQIFARRRLVFIALAVVTIIAGILASRVRYDNSIEAWFLEADPSLAAYNEFTEKFDADQIVVVGIFADNVFDATVLQAIDRVSSSAAELDNVHRVQSITNSWLARRIGGIADPGFRQQVVGSPLQNGTLVSEDAGAAAIVIYLTRGSNTFASKSIFVASLRSLIEREFTAPASSFAMTGGPVLNKVAQDKNRRDMMILIPVMILLILAFAYGVFRRFSLALLPLAVVGIAVTLSFGLMGMIGWHMTMLSAMLIPVILAVGVADSIHVLAGYRSQLDRGESHDEAVFNSCVRLLRPCFFTTVTTIVGLLSLLVSNLDPLREFAITAAVGVFAAFIVSLSFVPLVLLMLPSSGSDRDAVAGGFISRLLNWIYDAGLDSPRTILLMAMAVAIPFAWSATRIDVGLDPMSWFPEEDPLRAETERIDEAFGGSFSLEFLVSAPPGGLSDPATLRRIEKFETWLLENTSAARVSSVADLVKESARIARDEGASGYALPRSRMITEVLLDGLRRSRELSSWVTPDYSSARISARLPLTRAREIVREGPAVEQRMAAEFSDSTLKVQMTGHAVLVGQMQTYVVDSQIKSFTLALVAISLLMVLLLRSLVLGLLAMIPNLLPIIIGLGAMSLLDIALNPATVMIAAVALGVVVDDSVHFMTALRRETAGTNVTGRAIRATLDEVGRPVFVTSLLLATGFSILVTGSFLPSRQIGVIVTLIVIVAFVADLLLLPAILRLLPPGMVKRITR